MSAGDAEVLVLGQKWYAQNGTDRIMN